MAVFADDLACLGEQLGIERFLTVAIPRPGWCA
jgi:hypothetical protein